MQFGHQFYFAAWQIHRACVVNRDGVKQRVSYFVVSGLVFLRFLANFVLFCRA